MHGRWFPVLMSASRIPTGPSRAPAMKPTTVSPFFGPIAAAAAPQRSDTTTQNSMRRTYAPRLTAEGVPAPARSPELGPCTGLALYTTRRAQGKCEAASVYFDEASTDSPSDNV